MKTIWQGSPFFTANRRGHVPLAVVLHVMQGTMAGTAQHFKRKLKKGDSGSSAHYGVSKKGEVHQYVQEDDAAWANGRTGNPTWDMLDDPKLKGVNPNNYTVSIEHEGNTGEVWTPEMYAASVELCADICKRWKIPVDRVHIIGHYEIDSINRPFCPGKGVNIDDYVRDVARKLGRDARPSPPHPGDMRWSNYFRGNIVLTRYEADDKWWFRLARGGNEQKAQAKWSEMEPAR